MVKPFASDSHAIHQQETEESLPQTGKSTKYHDHAGSMFFICNICWVAKKCSFTRGYTV